MHHREAFLSDHNEPRYSDEEFAAIVQKATELQDQSSDSAAHSSQKLKGREGAEGLTIAEVREIGSEVGLERRFIDQAADDLALESSGLFGGALTQQAQGTFQHVLTEAERIEILDVVRATLKQRGEVHEVAGAVEWKSVGRIARTTVTINATSESVALRVHSDASGVAALTWLGTIGAGLAAGAGLVGALQPESVLAVVSIVGAGGLAGVGVARTIWSATTRAFRGRVQRIRDELARSLVDSSGNPD